MKFRLISGTAPETKILTKKGYMVISELTDIVPEIWTGYDFMKRVIEQNSEKSKLLTIKFSNGLEGDFAQHQKWNVFNLEGGCPREKYTFELIHGDIITRFKYPIIEGTQVLHDAYTKGYNNGRYSDCDSRYIPGVNYTIKSRAEWISGLIEARGIKHNLNGRIVIKIVCHNDIATHDLQYMLHCMGVLTIVKKTEYSKNKYLVLNEFNLWQINELGGMTMRYLETKTPIRHPWMDRVRVELITDSERTDITYGFEGPGIYAGVLSEKILET